jgi:hypothetical protein
MLGAGVLPGTYSLRCTGGVSVTTGIVRLENRDVIPAERLEAVKAVLTQRTAS